MNFFRGVVFRTLPRNNTNLDPSGSRQPQKSDEWTVNSESTSSSHGLTMTRDVRPSHSHGQINNPGVNRGRGAANADRPSYYRPWSDRESPRRGGHFESGRGRGLRGYRGHPHAPRLASGGERTRPTPILVTRPGPPKPLLSQKKDGPPEILGSEQSHKIIAERDAPTGSASDLTPLMPLPPLGLPPSQAASSADIRQHASPSAHTYTPQPPSPIPPSPSPFNPSQSAPHIGVHDHSLRISEPPPPSIEVSGHELVNINADPNPTPAPVPPSSNPLRFAAKIVPRKTPFRVSPAELKRRSPSVSKVPSSSSQPAAKKRRISPPIVVKEESLEPVIDLTIERSPEPERQSGTMFVPMIEECRRGGGQDPDVVAAYRLHWKVKYTRILESQGKRVEKAHIRDDGMALDWRRASPMPDEPLPPPPRDTVLGPESINADGQEPLPMLGKKTEPSTMGFLIPNASSVAPVFESSQAGTSASALDHQGHDETLPSTSLSLGDGQTPSFHDTDPQEVSSEEFLLSHPHVGPNIVRCYLPTELHGSQPNSRKRRKTWVERHVKWLQEQSGRKYRAHKFAENWGVALVEFFPVHNSTSGGSTSESSTLIAESERATDRSPRSVSDPIRGETARSSISEWSSISERAPRNNSASRSPRTTPLPFSHAVTPPSRIPRVEDRPATSQVLQEAPMEVVTRPVAATVSTPHTGGGPHTGTMHRSSIVGSASPSVELTPAGHISLAPSRSGLALEPQQRFINIAGHEFYDFSSTRNGYFVLGTEYLMNITVDVGVEFLARRRPELERRNFLQKWTLPPQAIASNSRVTDGTMTLSSVSNNALFSFSDPTVQVILIDMNSQDGLPKQYVSTQHPHRPGGVECMISLPSLHSHDGGLHFVTGGGDGLVYEWGYTGEVMETRRLAINHQASVRALLYSVFNSHLCSAGDDGIVRAYDMSRSAEAKTRKVGEPIQYLHALEPEVMLLESSPGEGLQFSILDWRMPRMALQFGYEGDSYPYVSKGDVAENYFIRGDSTGNVRLWDVRKPLQSQKIPVSPGQGVKQTVFDSLRPHGSFVSMLEDNCLVFSTFYAAA